MDGNDNDDVLKKEEAIKNKIMCRDYISARSLLLEALKTYPRLENASEMLIICEVLCSAQMALHQHGVDWYWVLQLFHLDETATVERQYRNLFAQLEPVKNDLPGATLALKLLNDAYSVLSDPAKRAAFNAKRNGIAEISSNSNTDVLLTGIEEFSGSSRTKRTVHENLIEEHGDERNKKNAKMKMICADEPSFFTARIISKDSAGVSVNLKEGNCSSSALHDFYDFEKDRKIDLFKADQIWAVYDQEHMPRRYAQVIKMENDKMELLVMLFRPSPQSYHEKRWCDSGLPAACGTFILEESKKITAISWTMFSHLLLGDLPMQPLEIYPKKGEVWAIYRDWDVEWCSDAERRKKCMFEIVEILTDYMKDSGVKVAYMVKVDGYKNIFQRYLNGTDELSFQIPVYNLFMFSHKVPAFRFIGGEIDGIANGMLELDPLAVPDNLEQYFPYSLSASVAQRPNNSVDSGTQNCKTKLSSKDFSEGQVWAVFDGPDAMPRSYARVIDVVSLTKVRVNFLNPHLMLDEEMQWLEESLPVVCGIFQSGRAITRLNLSRFSHLVKCNHTKKSFYRIFPQKGEIWAMYKNWNLKWKSSDFFRHQCQMVEIVSDFSSESGIEVCSLTEVKGCLTFFQKQMHEGFHLTRKLSRLEMLSFSHRVPAYIVVGISEQDTPHGSWHLEPSALPPKLLV